MTRVLLSHIQKSLHKIYLHSTQLYGVLKNNKRADEIIENSQNFLSLIKNKWLFGGYLTFQHPSRPLQKRPSSFSQFNQVQNIHEQLFEKIFLICCSLLLPKAEQKEDDEQFPNHPQIYVSRTFIKTKKICNMRRISNELKTPFIQTKNLFFAIY